jgi:hypothetical protein
LKPAASEPSGAVAISSSVIGSRPGEVLWTYYGTTQAATACTSTSSTGCGYGGHGDNILRLINPNGNANRSFGLVKIVCAMIYVFDDDQDMGECRGCALSPADVKVFLGRAQFERQLGTRE